MYGKVRSDSVRMELYSMTNDTYELITYLYYKVGPLKRRCKNLAMERVQSFVHALLQQSLFFPFIR